MGLSVSGTCPLQQTTTTKKKKKRKQKKRKEGKNFKRK
jgi:hypothetical protein